MKAKAQQNSSSQQNNSTNAASEDTKAGKSAKVAKETNPSSHLNTQNFSNGKIVANSNGKPESKQETIDQELEKYLKAQKLKPFRWGTQVEPLSNETMSKDFAEIGYSPDTIKALLMQKEPVKVDGLTQRPSAGFGKHVAGTGVSPAKPKKKPSTRGMPKYEALVLFAGEGTFSTPSSSNFWQEFSLTLLQIGYFSTLSRGTPRPWACHHPPPPDGRGLRRRTRASSPRTRRPRR